MKRIGKEIFRISELHNISKIHNTDRIGNMFHYGKVMGDKEIRQFELLLQILQKVNYLCLNGYVQCGNRLIADYELGIQSQSSRNTDSLSLSAGKLVWIPSLMEGLQTAFVHDLINILLIFLHRNEFMLLHRFSDDFSDRKSWRERGERILKDDLHLGTHLIHLILRNIVNLSSVKENLSCSLFPAKS